jgi:phosphoadenosine phosphosulfate reductase
MTEIELLRSAVTPLNRLLANAQPQDIIAEALRSVPDGRLAAVSSFGTESAVLLKFVADVDPSIPVLFLDTGWLFEETLAYRQTLARRLGLRDIRTLHPDTVTLQRDDPERDLWFRDPDACCRIRKVDPLAAALRGFDGWLNGRKRFHGNERSGLAVVEADGERLKFNALAGLGQDELQGLFETFDLPRHPLERLGFASVGCMPCTSRTQPGEGARAGRWRDRGKTECGIHTATK